MVHSRALAALLTAAFLAAPASAASSGPRGFAPAQLSAENRYEAIVDASPSEAQAMRDETGLASYVHRMGQNGDLRSATYMRDELAKAGWDAKLVEYVVPIAYPTVQRLTLLTPRQKDVDLYEPAVPGDPYSANHAAIGKPYSGYSLDGDVTGPVVYANHARPDDFKKLAEMHVNVRGAIIVARAGGGGSLTGKAFESAKHGARAVLIFADPMTGGYWDGDPYPKGPYRPTGGAMRNTMTFTNDPGDPTAIGIPVPGAKHKPFAAIKLPSIPEMPITANAARELLSAMSGPNVPSDWHPGFAMPVHTSGARAHFVIKSKRFFGPIWDVIATMPGQDPDQLVVVGGHRDAWTYGSVDPISGTVDMLQLGRAFGKLKAQGWKPQRTIVIGSWDGEELNLFGSDEWVEQHAAQLRAGCVAYVNTDEVAFGPEFGAYATPDMWGVLRAAASAVRAPDGRKLDAYWKAQDPKMTVTPIGGGSDHEPFVYHEGLPGAGAGFGGPFGTYHSAYDDIASLRIFDPGMHRAAAAARYTSMVVLRLADAQYPDLRLADLADQLSKRVTAFGKSALLTADAQAFLQAANALDARADADVERGDAAAAATEYKRFRAAEDAFFDAHSSAWQRSLLYSVSGYTSGVLPTLEDTQSSTTGDAALKKLDAAFKAATDAASPSGD